MAEPTGHLLCQYRKRLSLPVPEGPRCSPGGRSGALVGSQVLRAKRGLWALCSPEKLLMSEDGSRLLPCPGRCRVLAAALAADKKVPRRRLKLVLVGCELSLF